MKGNGAPVQKKKGEEAHEAGSFTLNVNQEV